MPCGWCTSILTHPLTRLVVAQALFLSQAPPRGNYTYVDDAGMYKAPLSTMIEGIQSAFGSPEQRLDLG